MGTGGGGRQGVARGGGGCTGVGGRVWRGVWGKSTEGGCAWGGVGEVVPASSQAGFRGPVGLVLGV